ncbi:hypothetical protein AAC387_Pa05g2890 [Persea americana]
MRASEYSPGITHYKQVSKADRAKRLLILSFFLYLPTCQTLFQQTPEMGLRLGPISYCLYLELGPHPRSDDQIKSPTLLMCATVTAINGYVPDPKSDWAQHKDIYTSKTLDSKNDV